MFKIQLALSLSAKIFLFLLLVSSIQADAKATNATVTVSKVGEAEVQVDWPTYLGEQDLIWNQLPETWMESPFIGNGLMGSMLFMNEENELIITMGRSDVQDHRREAGIAETGKILPDQSRLPIGHFILKTKAKLTGCQLRLNLWDAEIKGRLTTELGTIDLVSFIHSEKNLLVVDAKSSDGEAGFSFSWQPEGAFCPRIKNRRQGGRSYLDSYQLNPLPTVSSHDGIEVCTQELLSGGQTATAWHVLKEGQNERTLFASVGHSYPKPTALLEATRIVQESCDKGLLDLQQTHRAWWHAFYPKSFVSLPDSKLESFFWIQHYKMACATKGGKAIADNQGPWLQETSWPAVWWNLNVQLAYSHMLPANHPELSEGLVNLLAKHKANLSKNVPEEFQRDSMAINTISGQDLLSPVESPLVKPGVTLGNLPWAMHNAYMQYRYTMDEQLLRDKVYPILKASINFYRHFLIEGDDGKLHLPITFSPEYPNGKVADCNYDLALLRWGCLTLIESARILEIQDPLISEWQDILERLVEYPQDSTGYLIGKDLPYARSHRHYSHLLMFYPLATIDLENEKQRALARKSLLNWQKYPKGLAGYSYSGSSSMFSLLGEGEKAEQRLQDFLNDKILVNTFYKEGVSNPVIETPPAAARSIEDLLVQSWGDRIRVFPAIPDKWPDVSFANLRTEGAFLISATRKNGKTSFVKIKSLAGEPCLLQSDIEGTVEIIGQNPDLIQSREKGLFEFQIPEGESIILVSSDHQDELTIKPIRKTINSDWVWGKN